MQEGRGNRHYSTGHRADDWSAVVLWGGLGGAAGTVYVEVRQSLWEGGCPPDLAPWLLERGLRPSRVDLAADVRGAGWPGPSTLYRYLPAAETRTHRRTWELTLDWDGGEKLTVGARSSERYLRVYVKGDQWVRHELELKQAAALRAADTLAVGGPLGPLFGSEYARLIRWPS
jgi:DNA relaxase NicK